MSANGERSQAELLERVGAAGRELAVALREASEAGVSHALILPQLVLIFRAELGELPAGFTLPEMPG